MLTALGCRARQQRLFEELAARSLDGFVTGNHRTVYYFTGQLLPAESPCAFVAGDGKTALVAPQVEAGLAGEKRVVEVYSPQRAIGLPHADAAKLLCDLLPKGTLGVDRTASASSAVFGLEGTDASAMVLKLRRRKEPDEVDEIRASLRLCAVAYDAARRAIRPGVSELDVYLEMSAAVAREAGAPVPFPGDFACGDRSVKGGGPPTRRLVEAGDLYPLDLFPAPALYFGDTCRTFCAGEPRPEQRQGMELVLEALRLAESLVKPGVAARHVYAEVKRFLDDAPLTGRSFWHHLGHGIGLHGHEAPRLIAESDDVLEPGDVFTLEPGIYLPLLQGGIRQEDNYLVTERGIERLFDYPHGFLLS